MARFLVACLLSVVIAIMFVVPASAQEMEECQHEATISSLRACVAHAGEQALIDQPGITRGLVAKLDAAQIALDRGKTATAVNILQAFAAEVSAQSGKHIDAAHADHMVLHAQMVIAALNA